MKYIIMCGGKYVRWETPRQLLKIGDETIVERTVRLLRECGVEEVYISSNDAVFEEYAPVLYHHNEYEGYDQEDNHGKWTDCFYPMDEPACYIFGDVVFSPEAIQKIVETETDDIELFASAPPFDKRYTKRWAEPFALKVVNQSHLKSAITMTALFQKQRMFRRKPIMWELWQVIKIHQLNHIDYTSFTRINDYTCDVDKKEDLEKIKQYVPYTVKAERIE